MKRLLAPIAACLILTVGQARAEWPRWGQSPLPDSFNSQPPDQRKLMLARRYVDALHLGWFFAKSVKIGWAPAEDAFRARAQAKLSGPMLGMAMSDFEQALDGARLARQQEKNEYAAHFFAANMSEEDLKTAGEYYAGPEGQKMLLEPEMMTQEERRAQGQHMLAHPGLIRATQIQIRLGAAELKDVEKARLVFAKDFQARLCDALRQDHIQASLCSPTNAIR